MTKDAILQADDLPREELAIPEWKDSVFVRTLTGEERDEFEQICATRTKDGKLDVKELKALLATMTVCDAEGNLLFGIADAEALNQKSGAAIERIFHVAARLSHLRPEDVKELAGN